MSVLVSFQTILSNARLDRSKLDEKGHKVVKSPTAIAQFSSAQTSSTQLGSVLLNSGQLSSIQLNPAQLNPAQLSLAQPFLYNTAGSQLTTDMSFMFIIY